MFSQRERPYTLSRERETFEKGAIRDSGFEAPVPLTVAHSRPTLVRLSSAIGFLLSHRCGARTFCLSPQFRGTAGAPFRNHSCQFSGSTQTNQTHRCLA